jgi:DNA-binding NarL/FixJ family response regulator
VTARSGRPCAADLAAGYDPIAVAQTLAGDPRHTTVIDRHEAVRRLHAQGLTDPAVATRTGLSAQTVLRIRRRLALPPNRPASPEWADILYVVRPHLRRTA